MGDLVEEELPTIIGFEDGDAENPYNWSTVRRNCLRESQY